MKTPEEIKADAATCLTRTQHSACNRFALYKECNGDCGYIIKELYDLVLQLESSLAQVERERDAAVADLEDSADCEYCQHESIFHTCPETCCHTCQRDCPCARCSKRDRYGFKWRGMCEENTKEE